MLEVFFAYGLVFFVMGLAIVLQYRAHSAFQLATSLRYLAAFGFLHGLGEWGSVFIPHEVGITSATVVNVLQALQRLLWALSFTALSAFGVELLAKGRYRRHWTIGLPAVTFLLWFGAFVVYGTVLKETHSAWIDAGETWERYLLGLPALLLTTYAVADQYRVLRPFNPPNVTRNLLYLAATFGIYTVVGGLVVPYAPFFPASWLNSAAFLQLTRIPVQVVRSVTGLAMAYFTIRLLKIFNLETARQLEEADRQRSIVRERERISQDLHDGVIQRIYGAGLMLETAVCVCPCTASVSKDASTCTMVHKAMGELNQTIDDLRRYLVALEPVRFEECDLRKGLEYIVADFQVHSLMPIEVHAGDDIPPLRQNQTGDVYHIVLEVLQNIRRHSMATAACIDVLRHPDQVELVISDNGAGFDASLHPPDHGLQHHGLRNMELRAQSLGGSLRIESEPGRGTTVRLMIPVKG